MFVLLFAAAGLLIAGLGFPMLRRRVKPNRWYGLRVESTFADETVWYDANAASGRDLVTLGTAQLALAILAIPAPEPVYVFANVALLLLGTIAVAVVGVRRADRLLRERRSAT